MTAHAASGPQVHLWSGALDAAAGQLRRAQFQIALRCSLFAFEIFVAGAIGLMCLWGLGDLLFEFSPSGHKIIRAIYLILATLGLGALLAMVLAKVPRRAELAMRLEAAEPAFQGNLLAAVEALERPGSVPAHIAEHAAESAVEVFGATGMQSVMPRIRWVRTHYFLLSSMAVTLSAAVFFGPDFFRAFLRGLFPFEAIETALTLRIAEVRPGDAEVVEGDTVPVTVRIADAAAGAVYVQIHETQDAKGPAPAEHALVPSGEREGEWLGALGVLRRPAKYRILAYDAQDMATRKRPRVIKSGWFDVGVRPTARIVRTAVLVEPPGYAGYRPQWFANPASVKALARSGVTVLVAAAPVGDLVEGRMQVPGLGGVPFERLYNKDGLTFYRASFTALRAGMVRLELDPADPERLGAQGVFTLSVVPDRPPVADGAIPPDAAPGPNGLPIVIHLADDIGLTNAALVLYPLPGEEATRRIAAAELNYAIPIPPGRREIAERMLLPAEGLEEWLAAGFQYQIVAMDGALPVAQTGRSPMRKWVPRRGARGLAESPGMLEHGPQRPRSLARKNALGKVPDPTPDELAQLKDLGDGQRPPKSLQRPKSERLEGGKMPQTAQPNQGGGGEGASHRPGNAGDYERPQGLGGEQKQPTGQSGKGEGEGPSGEKGEKGAKGEAQGDGQRGKEGESLGGKSGESGDQTIGTQPGGKSGGQPGDKPREGGKSGQGGAQGEETADGPGGGEGETGDAGGGGGQEGGTQPSGEPGQGEAGGQDGPGGKGGTKKRDGGPKTGRETGAGSAKMAPPDVETLARMKGIGIDEARKYAQQQGMAGADSDFGAERAAESTPVGSANTSLSGPFDASTLSAQPAQGKARTGAKDAQGKVRLENIDPLYLPMVQGYFERVRRLSGE